jgi:predicted RNase H-like HicB family nuclease
LDGCFTQGETEKEALKNAKEAIICYLEGLEKVNQIKSKPKSLIKEIEVHV